jgi:hypothetical protein
MMAKLGDIGDIGEKEGNCGNGRRDDSRKREFEMRLKGQ